jgi:hypothetical protein
MRIPMALLLALLLVATSSAGELAGVALPDSVQVNGQTLVLNGMGLRKVVLFKVYVAGLYLPAKQGNPVTILGSDTHRQTMMIFLRGVGAEKICEAWYEGLEANTPDYSPELRVQFDVLCNWMEDMDKGDSMVYTYIPGEGTRVEVKGGLKGTQEGKAFADALFACWIGPKPGPGEKFKQGLLGE